MLIAYGRLQGSVQERIGLDANLSRHIAPKQCSISQSLRSGIGHCFIDADIIENLHPGRYPIYMVKARLA